MKIPVAIILFLALDAIVVYLVLRRVIKLKGSLSVSVNSVDFKKLLAFSKQIDEQAGLYLQANYSGDPQQLPQAMQGLLNMARARAEQGALVVDAPVLRRIVETAALKHRVAKAGEVRSALELAA